MRPSNAYFGPTVVLLSAHLIMAGIGVFLLGTSGISWPIRLLGLWALIVAAWMGWFIASDLIDP